jgi:hypothetical protein
MHVCVCSLVRLYYVSVWAQRKAMHCTLQPVNRVRRPEMLTTTVAGRSVPGYVIVETIVLQNHHYGKRAKVLVWLRAGVHSMRT